QQEQRPRHEPTPEHAVELADPRREPSGSARSNLAQRARHERAPFRPRTASSRAPSPPAGRFARPLPRDASDGLLVDGPPGVASGASPVPLGRAETTLRASMDGVAGHRFYTTYRRRR